RGDLLVPRALGARLVQAGGGDGLHHLRHPLRRASGSRGQAPRAHAARRGAVGPPRPGGGDLLDDRAEPAHRGFVLVAERDGPARRGRTLPGNGRLATGQGTPDPRGRSLPAQVPGARECLSTTNITAPYSLSRTRPRRGPACSR